MGELLNEQIEAQVREVFNDLKDPIHVLFFGREAGCDYCADTRQLLTEVTALSDKITFSTYDVDQDAELAGQYHVDKTPGIVIAGMDDGKTVDYGIRYAGIPAGHEFTSLINDLIMVSKRDSSLSPEARKYLAGLEKPVHLQVFVTPTWPYCPRAVVLAHQMALESPMVEAEMVEAMEFPQLSDQFGVSGVPQTTINSGRGTVVGAVPEDNLLAEIKRAIR